MPTLFAQAGHPLDVSARSTDPGSDDLTLAWDFGDGTTSSRTSQADPPADDPTPSPEVGPRDLTEPGSHTYTEGCSRTLTFTSSDDDGGSAAHETAVLVFGDATRNYGDVARAHHRAQRLSRSPAREGPRRCDRRGPSRVLRVLEGVSPRRP